jgi:RimJ/RimL family protein N-acetyltransferase
VPPTLDDVDWPVRTARLTIRPAVPADAALLWPYRRDPEVSDWLIALPTDEKEFSDSFAETERLASTLIVERDGAVIGDLHVGIQDGWSQAELTAEAENVEADIGWVLAPEHQGQGYGTEAVQALLALCFEQLGLRRVVAGCFTDNEPSWRLMERVGMRREQHSLRDGLHRTRGWLDGYQYALLAEEWATNSR